MKNLDPARGKVGAGKETTPMGPVGVSVRCKSKKGRRRKIDGGVHKTRS